MRSDFPRAWVSARPGPQSIVPAIILLILFLVCDANATQREEILSQAKLMADRLASVKEIQQTWYDAPYLVGCALVWEQLAKDGAGTDHDLWIRVDEGTPATGHARILHGDDTAYVQAALDLVRLIDDEELRQTKLSITEKPLEFADLVMRYSQEDGLAISGLWRDSEISYGCRFWQDDVYMMIPWLAMLGSGIGGLPADEDARNRAYEMIEAYAFDHRKALAGVETQVPSLVHRRREGWGLGDSSGRLLYDLATGLWWHDEGDPGSQEFWTRGNGWVAAGLARAQHFLNAPYSGGRYERWIDRNELRAMLTEMAYRVVQERNVFGIWNADIINREQFMAPESSGSALLISMLALGVNEGWLDETVFVPVVLKGFHALSLMVDDDGDLHHVQGAAAGPQNREFYSSDDVENLNFGVGAFLLAAAEVSRFGASDLAMMEEVEAAEIPRSSFTAGEGELFIAIQEIGSVGMYAAAGAALGAISGQDFLDIRFEAFDETIRVEEGGEGEITIFAAPIRSNAWLGHSYLIPAAAHNEGLGGAHWRSDVVIHNPGVSAQEVTLAIGPAEIMCSVAGNGSIVLTDIVSQILGFNENWSGSLTLRSAAEIAATSRTFNVVSGDGATYGQYIPAFERYQTLTIGDEARLLLLASSDTQRTNLGCASFSSIDTEVEFSIHALDGSLLGHIRSVIAAGGWWQENDALRDILTGEYSEAYAIVRVLTPGGAVVPYASIIDAATGDPSFVLAAEAVHAPSSINSPAPDAIFVPAAAHTSGFNNTHWRTDLTLHNPGDDIAVVSVAFLASGSNNTAPANLALQILEPGTSKRLVDVIGSGGFMESGSGALRVSPEAGSLMALSRTYTELGGTFGQTIPGLPKRRSFHSGEEGLLSHLFHSPDTTEGFRSNIGVVNSSAEPVLVEVDIFNEDGQHLGTLSRHLGPFEHFQWSNALSEFCDEEVAGAVAIVHPLTVGPRVFAYASVVDNRSGDPIYIAARVRPR